MPAISSRETIPNFPLNGYELAIYTVKVFEQVCKQRDTPLAESLITQLKSALENDWVFKSQFTYGGVVIEISVQVHAVNHESRGSFTILPTFHFPHNPNFPKTEPFVRRPLHCTAPPLEGFHDGCVHFVDCFTLRIAVENPNLVRVHCGLPITITEKIQPKHGEMFGSIKNHEVRYDPSEYETLPDPTVTDQTQEFCEKWGLPYEAKQLAGGVGEPMRGNAAASDPVPPVESIPDAGEAKSGAGLGDGDLGASGPPTGGHPVSEKLPSAPNRSRKR